MTKYTDLRNSRTKRTVDLTERPPPLSGLARGFQPILDFFWRKYKEAEQREVEILALLDRIDARLSSIESEPEPKPETS